MFGIAQSSRPRLCCQQLPRFVAGSRCCHLRHLERTRLAKLPVCVPQQPSTQTHAVSPEALNRALCSGSDWEEPAEGFNSIAEALTDLAQGKFVVVLDDESRENEGDLIMAAETMTTEAMAFMVEYTSGVICVPLEGR